MNLRRISDDVVPLRVLNPIVLTDTEDRLLDRESLTHAVQHGGVGAPGLVGGDDLSLLYLVLCGL